MFDKLKDMFLEQTEDNILERVKANAGKLNIVVDTAENPSIQKSEIDITDIESVSEHSLEDIYAQRSEHYGAFNETISIYKVDTFDKTLPINAMPSDVRKETLKNIITAAGYSIDELTNDYIARTNWLNEYKNAYITHENESIEKITGQIAELQRQIDSHNEDIALRNKSIADLNVLVSSSLAELERIYKTIN